MQLGISGHHVTLNALVRHYRQSNGHRHNRQIVNIFPTLKDGGSCRQALASFLSSQPEPSGDRHVSDGRVPAAWMFTAALTSAWSECPHERQRNFAWSSRFLLTLDPQLEQVTEVCLGSTFTTIRRRAAFAFA